MKAQPREECYKALWLQLNRTLLTSLMLNNHNVSMFWDQRINHQLWDRLIELDGIILPARFLRPLEIQLISI